MKKIKFITLMSLILLVLISMGIFYYQAAIGFGRASAKTVEAVLEIKNDLKRKNINLKDSIEIKIESIKKKEDLMFPSMTTARKVKREQNKKEEDE